MPQAGIVAVLEAIGIGAAAAAAAAVVIQTILINVALGYLSKKLAKRGDNSVPPVNVTLRGTVEPRHIILGTRRAGGVLVYYGASSSGGATNDLLWYVIVYAGHQVSSMTDVWFETEKISNSDISISTGAVTAGKFAGNVWIWKHAGTSGQTVDSNIDAAFAEWTSTHRLRGLAYAVIKMKRNTEVFQSAPQSITMLIDGALVYDPRLDSTNGGSGSQRAENPSTWSFSRNPALHALWFLTGGSVVNDSLSRMVKYGLRETYARVPAPYVIAAANICDEVLSGGNAPPSGSQPRYRCDLEATCGESRRDILNAILESMAGTATLARGQWQIFAGAYDTPVHTLTQDDLFGDIEIQDTTPHSERYNAVSATFIDASKQWAESTTPLRTDSSYETQDGGEQIPKELDLRAVTDQYQAQRLCEIELRRSRMQRTAKLPGALNLLKVAPWETLTYSHSRYGWTNRIFRCVERQFEYAEEAGRVTLTCRRDDPGVYTDMVTADYTTGTSATDVFQSDGPDSPTSLTATSVPGGILFVVGLPDYLAAGSKVEIYEHTASTPFGSATLAATFSGDRFVLSRRDTTTRYYWALIRDLRKAVSGTFPASTGQAAAAGLVSGTSLAQTPADGNIAYAIVTQPVVELYGIDGHLTYTAPSGIATAVQTSWSAQAQISNTTSGVAVGYARITASVVINGTEVYAQDVNLEGCTTTSAIWGSLAGSRTFNINGGDTIELFLRTGRKFSSSGSSPAQTMYWRSALLNLMPLNG